MTYAMGWFQQDYKGDKLNFHTGSLDGLTAINAQLPDKNSASIFSAISIMRR